MSKVILNIIKKQPVIVEPAPQQQVAEVTGIITGINYPKDGGFLTLKIKCPTINKTFDAVYTKKEYCQLRPHDAIYSVCIYDGKQLIIDRMPFARPGADKDAICYCIRVALSTMYLSALKLYNSIAAFAGGEGKVDETLSLFAQNWIDKRDESILILFGDKPEEVKKLLFWWHKERNIRKLKLLDLTRKEIDDCRLSCQEIYKRCLDNPYSLAMIPMEKCDAIYDKMNKIPTKEDKLFGSIIRILWKNLDSFKWNCVPTNIINRQFPDACFHQEILKSQYHISYSYNCAYLAHPYTVETWVANYLIEKRKSDQNNIITNTQFSMEMSEEQQRAVCAALSHNVSIVTGSAGSGKTRVLGQIIYNLELQNLPYMVCSFTGKAVARIREVTKSIVPSTMHRLIHNAKKDKKLAEMEYEHVVFDETSMITTELLYDFLQIFPNIKKLTFVGDCNQLQPIGWGSLFLQMLKSDTIPTYKLTTNYRVVTKDGERDGIILNANALITHDNEFPFEFIPTSNFKVFPGSIELVYDLIRGCFSAGINPEEMVILSPYSSRYLADINKKFQEIYDTGARFVTDSQGIKWRIGDRVMLNENDDDIKVFNGESGTIVDVSDVSVKVNFGQAGTHDFLLFAAPVKKYTEDEEYVEEKRTVRKLDHSFCITIDKSQGSEWPYVLLFLPEFNKGSFINKNRIYTAITRSKSICWIVTCDINYLNIAAIKPSPRRCDNLHQRLIANLPSLKPKLIDVAAPEDEEYDCDDY